MMVKNNKHRDAVFRKLMLIDPQNKVCFDCNLGKPAYGCLPLAVFICEKCAEIHWTLRLKHLVKSLFLEEWHTVLLGMMILGGNRSAKTLFKEHGWIEDGKQNIQAKYTSKLVDLQERIIHKKSMTKRNLNVQWELQMCPVVEGFLKEETDLARQMFPNAKSISSAHFFKEQPIMNDTEAKLPLHKFSGSSGISRDDLFGCGVNTKSAYSIQNTIKSALWKMFG